MMWLVLYSSLVLLSTMISVFDNKSYEYVRSLEKLKHATQMASTDGSKYFNLEEYSNGYLVYNYDKNIMSVEHTITETLNIDKDFKPNSNSYWRGDLDYEVYFYDESKVMKKYTKEGKEREENFTFPCEYEDADNGFKTTIWEPTVLVKIRAPDKQFRVWLDVELEVTRTASSQHSERIR